MPGAACGAVLATIRRPVAGGGGGPFHPASGACIYRSPALPDRHQHPAVRRGPGRHTPALALARAGRADLRRAAGACL